MKVTQFTRFVPVLGFACALGLAPAMAQTAGTMAPLPSVSVPAAPAPAATAAAPAAKAAAAKLSKTLEFKTQAEATAHCPGDTVVWSSLSKSHSYHTSDSKLFGKTKHGAYVCKSDAVAAGFHQAKN